MKLLSSLQNRIFLASALVAVLSVGLAIQFVTGRVTRQAEAELRRGVEEAGALVEQHHASRGETLTLLARLIADLPKLKAAVATGDPPTVEPLARDYMQRVQSDVFSVADQHGRLLVGIGPGAEQASSAIEAALDGHESITFLPTPTGVVQVVTVPLTVGPDPPEVLGSLSLGFVMDDALAARFKAVTASEVAIALDGRVMASTLPLSSSDELSRVLGRQGIVRVSLGGHEYEALARPLATTGSTRGAPIAIILRSRTQRLAFLNTFRTALLVAALVAILGAIGLSYVVARSVTRPLAAITAGMREMAVTGDLNRKIRLRRPWDDEDAALLASTFNALTDAIVRFQREAALEERLAALGRLSTVIAHEVRNPLMIIKGSLRVLKRAGATGAEIQEAAAEIDDEAGRLNRIVDDVLDFARPVRLEYAQIDLNALCREAAGAALTDGSGLSLRLSLEAGLAPIVTDVERLRTALVNVLSNAREAVLARAATAPAPERNDVVPPPADIELRTNALTPSRVAIVVEDRGVGIDAADLPHVFEPYFTSKRTGTGLGLAITRNIVDALGGTIAARPLDPRGTQVRLELPTSPPASRPTQGQTGEAP